MPVCCWPLGCKELRTSLSLFSRYSDSVSVLIFVHQTFRILHSMWRSIKKTTTSDQLLVFFIEKECILKEVLDACLPLTLILPSSQTKTAQRRGTKSPTIIVWQTQGCGNETETWCKATEMASKFAVGKSSTPSIYLCMMIVRRVYIYTNVFAPRFEKCIDFK